MRTGIRERALVIRKCPHCQTTIEKRNGDSLFLRNAILRVDLNTQASYAKCPRCKAWVDVPLRYRREEAERTTG